MPSFEHKPTDDALFRQGPPSPAMPGVNAPIEPESMLSSIGHGIADFAGGLTDDIRDPRGAMDRRQAARELQRKFEIVGDDHQGERLPNQVSQAEYDQVVRTYSDIRLGRADLKIDGGAHDDPDAYRANVMDDIGDIMQTVSGRSLIGQLANNVATDHTGAPQLDDTGREIRRRTVVHPRFLMTPDNKDVIRDPSTGAQILDTTNASQSGEKEEGLGAPYPSGRRGLGTDPSISYNPNYDITPSGGGRFRSDVGLYHEMVHALHDTRGTTDISMVSSLDNVRRDAARGELSEGSRVADPAMVEDAGETVRGEHQAVGLGLYRDDAISENVYRRERQLVAQSGRGMPGDTLMEQRDYYRKYQGTYNNLNGR
jgi:hypothetical protein